MEFAMVAHSYSRDRRLVTVICIPSEEDFVIMK